MDSDRKTRVLLIEDEYIVASAATEFLAELGYEVVAALGTLRQAMEAIPTIECDAAVLDIVLHNDDSMPIARELKRRDIPFGFASAWGKMMRDDPEFNDAPSISKPYDLDGMRKLMDEILGKSPADPATPAIPAS
jgi:DNA-binding NtrC family response regulator